MSVGAAAGAGDRFPAGGLVLGIETSCDESAAAVVAGGRELRSNVIASQVAAHRKFGGVVPEVASRKHLETIVGVVDAALAEAGVRLTDLSGVAVTYGPGLVGSLLVGVSTAKALALAKDLPLVGVHHVEAHIYANFLDEPGLEPPLVCLTVSGGHTALFHLPEYGRYVLLGQTRDDAAGEALDKVARVLGLGYPGGPALEKLAEEGDPGAVPLPRGLAGEETLDFSFSGLKTAALSFLNSVRQREGAIPPEVARDLAASLQWAVVDVLAGRAVAAAARAGVRTLIVSGGVAANRSLRAEIRRRGGEAGLSVHFPPASLCTDNAAMVACAGYYRLRRGERAGLDLNAVPNLPLAAEE
ncbi:MAG: tRNA (adenosine(37)-N6)-threonylcarbamoyltransferase complex transferase subunit TsaD [Bacillota bacterium]|nr:tRNA (adenosine(37)-N6)-threonylcarbamoyltransferase complex transferase subunit TsaD [Bacillota bacterium]